MTEDFLSFKKEEPVLSIYDSGDETALMTDEQAPWLRYPLPRHAPPLIRLHNEILSFCEHITPTRAHMKVRNKVVSELTKIVQEVWPSATVHVFGSQMTQILTPSSDIDITVLNIPPIMKGVKLNQENLLLELANKITGKHVCSYIEVITAKVPIIKLDHISSGLSVDICCMEESGLHTGALVKKMVSEFPPMRPLTILVKQFLAQRRLNETYHGGVGSFVLCMMVGSFLQHRLRVEQNLDLHLSWNLGSLLIDFLTLYSMGSFDYTHTAISVTDGGRYFPKTSIPEWRPSPLLSIENPHVPNTDMGKNSFLLPKIRRALEHALQLLAFALADPSAPSYLMFFIRTDDPLLQKHSDVDSGSEDSQDSDCVVVAAPSLSVPGKLPNSTVKTQPSASQQKVFKQPPSISVDKVAAHDSRQQAKPGNQPTSYTLLDIGGEPYNSDTSDSDNEESDNYGSVHSDDDDEPAYGASIKGSPRKRPRLADPPNGQTGQGQHRREPRTGAVTEQLSRKSGKKKKLKLLAKRVP